MHKLRYAILAVSFIFLMGCYEITEEIVINDNGSGTYITKMDMSALIEMMQTMAGEKELSKEGLDRPLDTVILIKSVLDSVKDMTPDQKELYKDGSVKLQMNLEEKIFKADIGFPYNRLSQLHTFMSGAGSGGLGAVFKKVYGSSEDLSAGEQSAPQEQGLDLVNTIFDIDISDGRISKKLNQERYKALMEKPEITQAKEMAGKGLEILYTAVIKLPRPVKQADNPLVKLSADKKTVTMKYNLLSLFDKPDKFSYTIIY